MKSKKIATIIACIMMTTTILNPYASYVSANTTNTTATSNTVNTISENSIYLSNLEHDADESAAWNSDIVKDTNINGSKIRLKVDGEVVTFNKGMGAHATSYLVYDISEYSDEYTRLSAYLGVDYSQAGLGNGVKFKIYTSNDKASWNLIKETDALTANGNALYVNLDVANAKYIKFYANTNGNNSNDHSVYADLRLIKPGYDIKSELSEIVKPLSYYDDILSKETVEDNYKKNLKLVLEREFVNRVGYGNIQNFVKHNQDVKEAVNWLLKDKDALELFIESGSLFNGSGSNTLEALGKLYKNYKDVLADEGDGYVYKKMLIATAVAYCKNIRTYVVDYGGASVQSDPVKKFEEFKKLYDEGKFLRKEEFKKYSMELVRYVMDAKMDDEEISWLSKYSQFRYPDDSAKRVNTLSYVKYTDDNYNVPEFYSEENRQKWDEKYKLTEYGINSYGEANRYRLWMLMEKGSICWGISGLGVNLNEVHGIPAVNIYQPNHEAYLVYSQDNNGNGLWNIWFGAGSWANTFSRWGNNTYSEARLLLGWGCKSYNSFNKNNGSYMMLAQGALNKYEAYKESLYYNLIANSYKLGSSQREAAYNKALASLDINLDSYDGLIESYKAAGNKTSQQWTDLAKRIIKAYTYYPLPMVEALNRITPYITDSVNLVEINTLKTQALNSAKNATKAQSLQPDVCKTVANSLLGNNTLNLASFSFDGEYANQIIINEEYENVNLMLKYSLDGGKTWKETQEHAIKLTEEEIKSITAENDIIVGMVAVDTTYTIDIKSGKTITTSTVYNNDLENLVVGDVEHLEYSLDGGTTWNDYVGGLASETRFTGNQEVKVRKKAYDTYLKGNELNFTFTQDEEVNPKESYLQLKNVSLHGFSSESNDLAVNFIDGSANTSWHTKYGIDNNKFYSVKFDKARFISKLTYLPVISPSGRLKSGDILTSMNGTTWEKVHSFTGLENSKDLQTITLPYSVEAMYLKIVPTETYGIVAHHNNLFFSGRMLNFYEDTTKGIKEEVVEESVETEVIEENVNTEVVEENVETEVDSTEKLIMVAKDLNINGTQESFVAASENLQSSYKDILNLGKGTITFKYKLDQSKAQSNIVSLMTISDKDALRSYASLYIKPTMNRIGIEIANRYVANQNVDVYVQNDSKPINNTDLQNISYVFDGTTLTVYLNGELFGSVSLSGFLNDVSWKDSADNVTIGANPRTNNGSLQYQWPFAGTMNEVRVQEEVLSAEEVKTLHDM